MPVTSKWAMPSPSSEITTEPVLQLLPGLVAVSVNAAYDACQTSAPLAVAGG